jgi:hypothetical protein
MISVLADVGCLTDPLVLENYANAPNRCDVLDATESPVVMDRVHYLEHPTSTSLSMNGRRALTTASLLAFCFFSICGGPAGSEDLIIGTKPSTREETTHSRS